MVLSDGHGTPLAVLTETASMHEVKLIEPLIKRVRIPRRGRGRPKKRVKRLTDDKAADSDPLRKRLKTRQIELIAPHRRGRRKPSMQDGRKLRRYRRRWKIERTMAWIQNYRRRVVRYERFFKRHDCNSNWLIKYLLNSNVCDTVCCMQNRLASLDLARKLKKTQSFQLVKFSDLRSLGYLTQTKQSSGFVQTEVDSRKNIQQINKFRRKEDSKILAV